LADVELDDWNGGALAFDDVAVGLANGQGEDNEEEGLHFILFFCFFRIRFLSWKKGDPWPAFICVSKRASEKRKTWRAVDKISFKTIFFKL
jgi:hypothetical protein